MTSAPNSHATGPTPSQSTGLLGAIEAGGTKFMCAVTSADGAVLARKRFATATPEETFAEVYGFFDEAGPLAAFGVGCFGPVSLEEGAPDFGTITSTPKPGWRGVSVLERLQGRYGVPVAIMTDVETAVLAEYEYGAGRGVSDLAYITIGTGIGCGFLSGGKISRGRQHSELGHYMPPIAPGDEDFEGVCPYHGRCMEGLASGPALRARFGVDAGTLAADDPRWDIEVFYLAQLCMTVTAINAPGRIILGGGVMKNTHLFPRVRERFAALMNGYMQADYLRDLDQYIVPPGLPEDPGLVGAMLLAGRQIEPTWRPDVAPLS